MTVNQKVDRSSGQHKAGQVFMHLARIDEKD
jgi:hypothetical protein